MITGIRVGVLLGCLLLALGCGDAPTAPTAMPPVVQAPASPFAGFPPVSSLARVFDFSARSTYEVSAYTIASRFVLQRGGTFSLQYASPRIFEYVGTYTEADGNIAFTFVADGRWDAVGTLNGDSLDVRYGLIMGLSDFENAVYRRSQ